MPLIKIDSQIAVKKVKEKHLYWPSSEKDTRLDPYAAPKLSPSFQIQPSDRVFCMGSCFARNIEAALLRLNLDCVTARVFNPYIRGAWGDNNFLIRYNPFSMLNELTWALDPTQPFPKEGYLPAKGNLWTDPHNHAHYEPHSKDRLVELRRRVGENTQKIKDCRIFIMTLGLVEAWYDHEIQKYANVPPDFDFLKKNPRRFELRVLSYEEILEALEKIYTLLQQYGHPDLKMLLSVSPVPLSMTYRDCDVMTANCYSKSVLRAAAESFCNQKEFVDYFPSYESITLSKRSEAWGKDQRHVTEEIVRFNVTQMVKHYISPDAENYDELAQPFVKREPKKSFFKKLLNR